MTKARHLFLMRHAKALPDSADGSDHARALSPRGWAQLRQVAPLLNAATGDAALHVLCSDARRTRETWDGLERAEHPVFEPALYLASASVLDRLTRASVRSHAHVLMIGHNPGLRELNIARLNAAAHIRADEDLARQRFPTSWIAWHQREGGENTAWTFNGFLRPGE